jgi:hypothetical protein
MPGVSPGALRLGSNGARGAGQCRWCIAGDGVIEAPNDSDRRWWLERLSDEEIAETALFMFGHRPDREHIRSERERLLGRVVVAT